MVEKNIYIYFCQYQIMVISIPSAITSVTAEESRQTYREWGGANGNLNRLKTLRKWGPFQ